MTQLSHAMIRFDVRWARLRLRLNSVARKFRAVWRRILATCSVPQSPDSRRYRHLQSCCCGLALHRRHLSPPAQADDEEEEEEEQDVGPTLADIAEVDPDQVVALKVSLLGDCHIGKTSFMNKYMGNAGEEEEQSGLRMTGLNLMDKILFVRGARIALSIWDVKGDHKFLGHVPIACKDAVAILIMFDLTSRCTLNNALSWYQRARKWNKTAIPILIGTKFDNFAQLPLDMQWAIVNEARVYARAMKATLFFSSATHNINVSKIFKYIIAKLFKLPWTVEKNLTIGEPIIDF